MEPVSAAVAFLAYAATRAGGRVGDRLIDGLIDHLRDTLREHVGSAPEEQLRQSPTSPAAQARARALIERSMHEDREFRDELTAVVVELRRHRAPELNADRTPSLIGYPFYIKLCASLGFGIVLLAFVVGGAGMVILMLDDNPNRDELLSFLPETLIEGTTPALIPLAAGLFLVGFVVYAFAMMARSMSRPHLDS